MVGENRLRLMLVVLLVAVTSIVVAARLYQIQITMGERFRIPDVVRGYPLDVGTLLVGGTEHVTADATEAVDPDAYRHPHTSFVDSKRNADYRAGTAKR